MSGILDLALEASRKLDAGESKPSPLTLVRGVGTGLPLLLRDWPKDRREAFEERWAIMIHDGGLPRAEARLRAEARIRIEYAREQKQASPPRGASDDSPAES